MSMLVLRRILVPNQTTSLSVARVHIRGIHSTTVALKKKRQAASTSQTLLEDPIDDYSFDSTRDEDELFGTRQQPSTTSPTLHGAQSSELIHQRTAVFDVLRTSTLDILGTRGKMRQPPRKSATVRLIALSDTKEDLEKVLDVIAAWRSAAFPHETKTIDEFIGRCARLNHPEVALTVFQDRPKYGMDVPSMESARQLLHALARPRPEDEDPTRPLAECLAFADIYPLYGLPPASTDVVSCAILASVILRQKFEDETVSEPQKDVEVEAVPDPRREIMAELEKGVKGWRGKVMETSPRTMTWLRRSMDDIHQTMRLEEGGTEKWMKRFIHKIRSSPVELS